MPQIPLRDGANLDVKTAGSGRPVILISGLGGTSRFWEPLVKAFGSSLQTIRFDQRGIGNSERGDLSVNIVSLAKDTWEIIDTLKIERPILCGHSTGGAIAQEMALARPNEAAGLILSGSWAGPDPFVEGMFHIRLDILNNRPHLYSGLSALLASSPRWHRQQSNALQQAMAHSPTDAEVHIVRERIEALLKHDCRDRIKQLDCEALILGAEDDMIIPVYLQEELAAELPNASINIFDKGGHFYPNTKPHETASVIQRWINSLPKTAT